MRSHVLDQGNEEEEERGQDKVKERRMELIAQVRSCYYVKERLVICYGPGKIAGPTGGRAGVTTDEIEQR